MPAYPKPFLLACLCAPLAAQAIPVSGGGVSLQQAVASAPSGAVLLVGPGMYDGFAATVAKSLTIIGSSAVVLGDVYLNVPAGSGYELRFLDIAFVADLSVGDEGTLHTNADLTLENVVAGGLEVTANTPRPRVFVRGATIASATMVADCVAVDSSFVGGVDGGFGEGGLSVTGSLRAERVVVRGAAGSLASGIGLVVEGDATIADSIVEGAPDPSGLGDTWALYNQNGSVTVSGTVLASALNPYTTRELATARLIGSFGVGLVSTYEISGPANVAAFVVLASDLVPWTTPAALEQLWVGATPNYVPLAIGLTNAAGLLQSFVPIPVAPALRYERVFLTGVLFDPIPLRTSAPVGGVIR